MSSHTTADIIIYANAGFFFLMGLVTLIRPVTVTENFRIPTSSPDMRNETRAVYGGFGVALSILLLATFHYRGIRDGVLLIIAVALLGMAAGRIVSFAIERPKGPHPIMYFIAEIILGLALLYARSAVPYPA